MNHCEIDYYIKENITELKALTIQLCEIPSMTGSENNKALFIKDKIKEYTGEDAQIDEAGNVVYIAAGEKNEKGLLIAAHIDTVFKNLYKIEVIEKEGKLYAPSIMDNSVNAAALLFIIKMFKKLEIKPLKDVIFAFTVGEEGTGNLKGIKNVVGKLKDAIDQVIAVDCNLDTIVNKAVGSKRYEVAFKTKGGHSWSDFGNKSAILCAARLVQQLYNIKVPVLPKTTYNAGIINGGTSVNTIAGDAEVLIDLRSEDENCLDMLNIDFMNIIKALQCDDVSIYVSEIGDRPCGCISEGSDLLRRVIETRKELGLEIKFVASSTDANVPLSIGIPAVTFGVCSGEGTHTINEFLYIDSIEIGIRNLAYLVANITL